jgi:hypothetical protein
MAKKRSDTRVRRAPNTVLRLPDLEQAESALLNSLSSMNAHRGYRHAIDEFIDSYAGRVLGCATPRAVN